MEDKFKNRPRFLVVVTLLALAGNFAAAEQSGGLTWISCDSKTESVSETNSEAIKNTTWPRNSIYIFVIDSKLKRVAWYIPFEQSLRWIDGTKHQSYTGGGGADYDSITASTQFDTARFNNESINLTCESADYCSNEGTQGGYRSSNLKIDRRTLELIEVQKLHIGPRADGYFSNLDFTRSGKCVIATSRPLGPPAVNKI